MKGKKKNKTRKYLIVEYIGDLPVGNRIELNTKHKNFLKMLADAKHYLERKDLRRTIEP